ncbi:MAG: cysteine desulfurase family protein [Actinomycetota bacterium]|nr:cysteine desulfurase family protein [Actinomycetota bacterium]
MSNGSDVDSARDVTFAHSAGGGAAGGDADGSTRHFVDHAATTPLLPQAREAWLDASAVAGNPSSLHASGRAARRIVEQARESIADDLRTRPSAVVFTSGGTESDNLAVKGLLWARRARLGVADPIVAASAIEHHAVLDPVEWLGKHEGADVRWIPVDASGRVDVDFIDQLLSSAAERTALVSVMWANNEVGTVQPVREIAAACRSAGVPFNTDAVQALGQLPVDLSELGATAVTISGHKVGGPFGIGALIVDPYESLVAVSHGGGQERDIRSGTFDAPAAAAFAVAVHHAVEEQAAHAAHLRSLQIQLAEGIASVVPDAIINGPVVDPATRLPGNVHASFPGAEGDALLMLLDAAGVDCSTGSACTAGVPEPSHVLLAMGVDERTARSSLRFSFGRTSTDEDVAAIIRALPGAVERARRAGSVSTDRYRAARENEVDR